MYVHVQCTCSRQCRGGEHEPVYPGGTVRAIVHVHAGYSGDITRELRPVFTREIAFQRQNSLKFACDLARNSFLRFEGVNHGHTPGLA